MDSEANIVSSKLVMMFRSYLARRGEDIAALLDTCGIDSFMLTDPSAVLHIKQFARLMEAAAHKIEDPSLGLKWALVYPLSGTGILGYVIQHSRDVREALLNSARYANLTISPVETQVIFEEFKGRETAQISWSWPDWLEPDDAQYKLFMTAIFVLRLRADTSRPWGPYAVRLQVRDVGCREALRTIFGDDTTFNAPRNTVVVDAADLNWTYAVADRRLLDILTRQAERLLISLPSRGELVQQVRSAILDRLGKGEISLDVMANELGLTSRALRARLAQQSGLSFEAILTETRRDLARYYLRETDMQLTEIALMLGYSELSAFTRAFQRWSGASPRAFRHAERNNASKQPV